MLLTILACLIPGCGLPDRRPDLAPPRSPGASDTEKTFTFRAPDPTAAPFIGVEVYYRFFPVGERGEPGLSSRVGLMTQGFIRIASPDDLTEDPNEPLIERPAAGTVVTLDFDPPAGGEPFVSFQDRDGVTRNVILRRGAAADDGTFKRFRCGEFESGDADVTGDVSERLMDDCAQVRLQVYALSYGRTVELSKVLYSDVLFLGEIDVTFGP